MTRPMAFILAAAAAILIYAAGVLIGMQLRPVHNATPASYGIFEQAITVEYSI